MSSPTPHDTRGIPSLFNRGFTLLEVMVSLLLLSAGLLGLFSLQMTSVRFGQNSSSRTQATMIVYELMDRMRANVSKATDGSYAATAAPSGTVKACDTSDCTPAEMVTHDVADMYAMVAQSLPGATATIAWAQDGDTSTCDYTVTVGWVKQKEWEDGTRAVDDKTAFEQVWGVVLLDLNDPNKACA